MLTSPPFDPLGSAASAVRDTLRARERELRAEVAVGTQRQRDAAAGTDHEPGDRQDEAEGRTLASVGDAELERDLGELREISDALHRLDAGSYGLCKHCGEAIDPRRLAAEPFAVRCTVCQAQTEQAEQVRR
jgi:DnaK suppressor protein